MQSKLTLLGALLVTALAASGFGSSSLFEPHPSDSTTLSAPLISPRLALTSASYSSGSEASIQVTIQPMEAVIAGARWRVDHRIWQQSGAIETGLSFGTHRVEYMAVAKWTPPAAQDVLIMSNQTYGVLATYVYQGDAWDPADDTSDGAHLIKVLPNTPVSYHGPHTLSDGDQADWFYLPLQAGNGYLLQTQGVGDNYGELYSERQGFVKVVEDDNSGGAGQFAISFQPSLSGNYYLLVRRAKETGTCAYSLATSATVLSTDLKLVSADFSPAAPTPVQPGQTLACSWTLSGPDTNAQKIWLELFASKSGGFDLERFGGTVTNSYQTAHTPGQHTYAPTSQILTPLPDGLYTLVASVNRKTAQSLSETTYTNNMGPISDKRLLVRNLSSISNCDLAWQTPPTFTRTGSDVTVSGTLTNRGSSASPTYGFWIETMYGTLSREGSFERVSYLGGGSRVYSALAPGQTQNYSKSGKLPPGNWAVAVLLDSTDLVRESDETNNYLANATPTMASGTVDLELISAAFDDTPRGSEGLRPGDLLTWNVAVRNHSATDSGRVYVELFASRSGGLDILRAGTSLTYASVSNIGAGQTRNLTFTTRLDQITDGLYSLVAIVNRSRTGGPADPVPTNNRKVLAGQIYIENPGTPGPNLVWQVGPSMSLSGTSLTISGTLRNAGSAPAGAFWTEMFFGTFDEMGVFTKQGFAPGGLRFEGLAAGETRTYEQTTTIPAGAVALGVITDSTDLVYESDETDNYHYFVLP